jgi:putative PIN family toxin of toxin-antitoxin system
MRLVLDTNVVVAALRSGAGASAEILRLARLGRIQLVGSMALALEYLEVCERQEHITASGLDQPMARMFIEGVCATMKTYRKHWSYRPVLNDPDDEMVLEAAINGVCDAIVTFNQRDFLEARLFGIEVLLPRDVLRRI